jgi:homoserine kinase
MHQAVTRVPATTANLGPGYDCLGIALALGNRITVTKGDPNSTPADDMASQAANRFFATARVEPFPYSWSIQGEVPQSRGMGSSVTVRLGILHGLNELVGRPLDAVRIFMLCAELEGHPDNAAPAAFGGFAVSKPGVKPIVTPVDESLHFILLIPDFEVSTPAARKVLPSTLDHERAVESCVNACRITAAFLTRDYGSLRGAFTDHFHQPHRESLIPFLSAVIRAGEDEGALGGWLSGSGSTICCLTQSDPKRVAQAMLSAANSPGARTVITHADNRGTLLVNS